MIAALDGLESRPDGVFVVGCGVDIVSIKQQLDAMVSVRLSAPEEPDMALARGAALASANAPLFASSTAALAYALDPGTGGGLPHRPCGAADFAGCRCRVDGRPANQPPRKRSHKTSAGAAERARTCCGRARAVRAAGSTAATGTAAVGHPASADHHGTDTGPALVAAAGCDPGAGP
jgi:hypothetical protein